MNRRFFFLLSALWLLVVAVPSRAAGTLFKEGDSVAFVSEGDRQWPESLVASLEGLLEDPMFQRSQVAVVVYDLDDRQTVFDYHGRQLMRPASVMKLLTSCSALSYLGADYCFRTRLYIKGEVVDSTLTGDVILKGGFDPMFSSNDMAAFIEKINERGIRRIEGRILADLSFKDTLKWGEGWCWDDKEATLTPLLYDGKDVFMQKFMLALDRDSIVRPQEFGRLRTAERGVELVAERTHTVSDMLTHMMKASDNLYAESLFYQLPARDRVPYASAKNSAEKVYEFIKSLGMDPKEFSVADGSGLSLYNYLTPQLIIRLLRHAWERREIFDCLYPTLPVSGVDGTLKKRMKGSLAYGKIHAKTGTLRKVSTLAGYTKAANGHNLAFCIFNQGILNSDEGRAFQDRVCVELVK